MPKNNKDFCGNASKLKVIEVIDVGMQARKPREKTVDSGQELQQAWKNNKTSYKFTQPIKYIIFILNKRKG